MPALDQSEWAVADRPAANRFVMSFPGGEAFAVYRKLDAYIVVSHTEVPAAFRGRGIGERLVEGVFRLARERGQSIVPACSFVADWARRHPEFHDVLAASDGARR
ncbi:GNAT family N-acetyltransferase [Bosea beijingensis]|uniref:GNAT family N-acetyltransferase n=1 Tax=Bosea beijingensis TaxID=3068632 RepID=UPI0027405B63|nr:GNAT family N-acetyltransferase [Bosea sp. REN20]